MTFYPSIAGKAVVGKTIVGMIRQPKAKHSRFPTIHGFDGNDLDTQGYGALSDAITCEVTEELNGGYTLEMKYPLLGVRQEYLFPGNIIMAKPNHSQVIQPFRISQVKKSLGNSISVYANHISYDLSGYVMLSAQTYNSLSAVLNAMNSKTWDTEGSAFHQFHFDTDIYSTATFSMPALQTMKSWMGGQDGSILGVYGGEWQYNGFDCILASRRGQDTGIRISYGKNLAGYDKQNDYSQYSHICAYWKNSDTVVTSDLVQTRNQCAFRVAYYDATKEYETAPTVTQLNASAAAQVSKANTLAENIKVTPAQIGNNAIGLGDTVLICYEDVFETRVIKVVWDVLADNYKMLELGTKKESITDTIKSLSSSGTTATPADYVIQQGTSNGWTFKKWASGDYECWYAGTATNVAVTTGWGGLYYGSMASVDFPITFTAIPSVQQTIEAANGGAWAAPVQSTTAKAGSVYLYRPTSSTVSVTQHIYAKGKWK